MGGGGLQQYHIVALKASNIEHLNPESCMIFDRLHFNLHYYEQHNITILDY